MSTLRMTLGLIGFVVLCLAAGGIGSIFTAQSVGDWYVALRKPSFNPPSWVFGPVWTALYIAMGVAAWLVWRRQGAPGVWTALAVFGVQLALNVLWSYLFFGLRLPGVAFAEILVLWAAILATILLFRPISPLAAWLLVPYLAWVSFASLLNFSLWRLNA